MHEPPYTSNGKQRIIEKSVSQRNLTILLQYVRHTLTSLVYIGIGSSSRIFPYHIRKITYPIVTLLMEQDWLHGESDIIWAQYKWIFFKMLFGDRHGTASTGSTVFDFFFQAGYSIPNDFLENSS